MEGQIKASMSALPSFSVFKSKSPLMESDNKQDEASSPKRLRTVLEVHNEKDQQTCPEKENSVSSMPRNEEKLEKAFSALRTFPSSFDLFVPTGISYERLDTFLLMYKTHCHRMIDAILSSDFGDVQVYLNHFWSEIPEHLLSLVETDFLSRVVETCDNLFYEVSVDFTSHYTSSFHFNAMFLQALEIVLIPNNCEDISEHVVSTLEVMMENFPLWVNYAIRCLPSVLVNTKLRGECFFLLCFLP
jgi:regulatory factor X 6